MKQNNRGKGKRLKSKTLKRKNTPVLNESRLEWVLSIDFID